MYFAGATKAALFEEGKSERADQQVNEVITEIVMRTGGKRMAAKDTQ